MRTKELLVRTVQVAKFARRSGFEDTACAFDDIAEILMAFVENSVSEKRDQNVGLRVDATD